MAQLQVTDVQVAHAFDAGWGLQEATVKRVGEWRRGDSAPQSLARAQRLEDALLRLATDAEADLQRGDLVTAWQEQRELKRQPHAVRPVHSSVRSAINSGEEGDYVRLSGFVRRHHPTRRTVFFDVSDGVHPNPLQFGAASDEVDEQCWERVRNLHEGDRVRLQGTLRPNRRGDLVAWLSEPPHVQEPITDKSLATAAPEQRRVAAAVVTAAIRDVVEDLLKREGFLSVATRVLSTTWPSSSGVRPLIALYPGFGSSAFVAPSPSPQLVDAILLSGSDRVFTSAHCFTTSFRDDLDGVEVDMLMAKATDLTVDQLSDLVHDIFSLVGRYLDAQELVGQPLHRITAEWPALEHAEGPYPVLIEAVTAHVDGELRILRGYVSATCAPVEATIEPIASTMDIATLTVFPSRFLALAESTPIRRIHPLGGSSK